jgi:hypothetical protein
VDPFGHFDLSKPEDLVLGMQLFLPVLLVDAAVLLPDYSVPPSRARSLSRLFPGAEADPEGGEATSSSSSSSSAGDSQQQQGPGSATLGEAGHAAEGSRAAEAAFASSSSSSGDGGGGGGGQQDLPLAATLDRVKATLDVLQRHFLRDNPTAGISPVAELSIICVSCLADEMLYRWARACWLLGCTGAGLGSWLAAGC